MSISTNLAQIQERIRQAALECGRSPQDVTLVAATKTQTHHAIRQAIAAGVDCCGENRSGQTPPAGFIASGLYAVFSETIM